MNKVRCQFQQQGFLHIKNFFDPSELEAIRQDAKFIFYQQLLKNRIVSHQKLSDIEFEQALYQYFKTSPSEFIHAGKTCQHLISLHRLALKDQLITQLKELGLERPNICTRPVIYFNSPMLALKEHYHQAPAHQDWRSMQGSLNSMIVWVSLIDVDRKLGALEVIPGSHLEGLRASTLGDIYFTLDEAIEHQEFQALEVSCGDLIVFNAFLVHRSGINSSSSIRWSCHFRYNDLTEPSFIDRGYPNPYSYKCQEELMTFDFPTLNDLKRIFPYAFDIEQ